MKPGRLRQAAAHWAPNLEVPLRRQNGTVLTVALIALVAMVVAGAALVRALEPGGASIREPQQQRAALQNLDAASNDALLAYLARHPDASLNVTDVSRSKPSIHYFATEQPLDEQGVPLALSAGRAPAWTGSGPTPTGWVGEQVDGESQQVRRYLIERLCRQPGDANADHCRMAAARPDEAERPYLRITVRIDGPHREVVYGQMLARAESGGSASSRMITPPD